MKRKLKIESELPDIGVIVKQMIDEQLGTKKAFAQKMGIYPSGVKRLLAKRNWSIAELLTVNRIFNIYLLLHYQPADAYVPATEYLNLQQANILLNEQLTQCKERITTAEGELADLKMKFAILQARYDELKSVRG